MPSFFFLFTTLAAFITYFYLIGARYVGIIPLVFFIILTGYYARSFSLKEESLRFLEQYGLGVAWLILLGGLGWFLHFFGLNSIMIGIVMITINIFLWLISYLISYKDGTHIFQVGHYLSMVYLLFAVFVTNTVGVPDTFSMLWFLQLSLVAFIVFVVNIIRKTPKTLHYQLWILIIGAVMIIISTEIKDIYSILVINSLFLTGIYRSFYHILSKKPPSKEQVKKISVRRILAGERILEQRETNSSPRYQHIYLFLQEMPMYVKYLLESGNMILLWRAIVSYVMYQSTLQWRQELLYRWTIIIFIINSILLKKIWYTSFLQRFAMFLVINFAIYLSLFSLFGWSIGALAGRAILRNIASTIMIFYVHRTPLASLIKKIDYIFWIVAALIALIINIILLIKINIAGQLLFSLIFVYIGIQGMILFYAIRYVRMLHQQEE